VADLEAHHPSFSSGGRAEPVYEVLPLPAHLKNTQTGSFRRKR